MLCLGLVVAPIGLLAVTRAAWALTLTLLSLVGAVALLAGLIAASFSDHGELAHAAEDAPGGEPETVVQVEHREVTAGRHGHDG